MKLLFLLPLIGLLQQPPQAPTVQFTLDRPATRVNYHFTLHEDGTGTYTASYPATPPATPAQTVDVPLMLHPATARKIFDQARSTVPLHGNCETKIKNIAQTGTKTLSLTQQDGPPAMCTWNYSEKAAVSALQDEFISMATTLDAGRRLKMLQRFDRLGMDHEMTYLLEQAKSGQAQGLENIAPILVTIVEDTSLLERVRSRATTLLDMSKVEHDK